MDEGKSQFYEHAIEWLKRAREAYGMTKKEKEWKTYQAQLLQKHVKKYKLKEMMQKL